MYFLFLISLAALFGASYQRSTTSDSSYVAAVVEYAYSENSTINIEAYLELIQEAANQNADIVVFPELTLSYPPIPVPINGTLKQYPVPFNNASFYDSLLVKLSEAAFRNGVYLVVNLQELCVCSNNTENENCPENIDYTFNTNVVFDRSGAVIDRYRKVHLFQEPTRVPSLDKALGVFETDFGVTFGHFICFDLLFQVPAQQVVYKYGVKDVIFTTMWYSESPYLSAVQIQQAYAYAMDVNFIAAGANNITVGSGGSGIYSGKAGAITYTYLGEPKTQLLVARVPKTPGQVTTVANITKIDTAVADAFYLKPDPSLPAHETVLLEEGYQEIELSYGDVECNFKVNLTFGSGAQQYKYMATAMDGVRAFGSPNTTGGTRVCSIVACTSTQVNSCGARFLTYATQSTATFHSLSIMATTPTPIFSTTDSYFDSIYLPVSLNTSIVPLPTDKFTYNTTSSSSGNKTIHLLNLNGELDELYGFGVYGRYFVTDGSPATPSRSSGSFVYANLFLVMSLALLLRKN